MGKLVKMSGLQLAESVYIQLKDLMHRQCYDQFDTPDIRTYGFCHDSCTGYHFSSDYGYCCTVINNPVTNELRIVYGTASDFHSDTRTAKETALYVDLQPTVTDRGGEIVYNWLRYGNLPMVHAL